MFNKLCVVIALALAPQHGRIQDVFTYSSVRTLCTRSGPGRGMYADYVPATLGVRCQRSAAEA